MLVACPANPGMQVEQAILVELAQLVQAGLTDQLQIRFIQRVQELRGHDHDSYSGQQWLRGAFTIAGWF